MDLNESIREMSLMLPRLLGEDIELVLSLSENLWPVKINSTQFDQVLLNLAINARDAMPQGGRLLIETANVFLNRSYANQHFGVEPGEYVLLAVSDTGVGMSEEVKARIFEPFFTTKGPGQGTGLGLSTVYGIIRQYEGHISVYSEVGQGATFKLYLPLAANGGNSPASGPGKTTMPTLQGSETVLVVEDEALVREMIRDLLTAHGYQVLTAQDGVEGLQIAQDHQGPIHLLLTDVVMPRMSGRILAEQLHLNRPETRLLYVSGYTGNEIAHRGVLEDSAHFLSKPFDPEALVWKVRDILDGRI
ncbi:MAG: ATP-binding protein [Anaerolineae bacterium]